MYFDAQYAALPVATGNLVLAGSHSFDGVDAHTTAAGGGGGSVHIQLGVIEGVEDIQGDTATDSGSRYTKIIENGILYILRDGEKYEVTGKKVPVAQ